MSIPTKLRKTSYYIYGCFGFFGFFFFRFFSSHNLLDLASIAFFASFSNFIYAKIYTDCPDERYYENQKNAKAFTGNIAIIELCICFAISVLFVKSYTIILIFFAFVISSCSLSYSIKFYLLEKK